VLSVLECIFCLKQHSWKSDEDLCTEIFVLYYKLVAVMFSFKYFKFDNDMRTVVKQVFNRSVVDHFYQRWGFKTNGYQVSTIVGQIMEFIVNQY